MEKKNETFTYTYSAKDQSEVQRIRQRYLPPEEDKMELLRRLDASVNQKGLVASLTVGITGTLILGIGVCFAMVWKGRWFIPGIVIGSIGIGIMALGNPIYRYVIKKERGKIAPRILNLSDELLK